MKEGIELGKAIVELGFSAAAMILVLGLVVWHQYRLAPIMNALVYSSQRLIESADKLSADLNAHDTTVNGVVQSTIQHAKDTHATCISHGDQLDDILLRLSKLEGRLEKQ